MDGILFDEKEGYFVAGGGKMAGCVATVCTYLFAWFYAL